MKAPPEGNFLKEVSLRTSLQELPKCLRRRAGAFYKFRGCFPGALGPATVLRMVANPLSDRFQCRLRCADKEACSGNKTNSQWAAIIRVFDEGFGEGLFAKSPSPTSLRKSLKLRDRS